MQSSQQGHERSRARPKMMPPLGLLKSNVFQIYPLKAPWARFWKGLGLILKTPGLDSEDILDPEN